MGARCCRSVCLPLPLLLLLPVHVEEEERSEQRRERESVSGRAKARVLGRRSLAPSGFNLLVPTQVVFVSIPKALAIHSNHSRTQSF